MRPSIRRVIGATGVAALAATLAACGGGSSDDSGGGKKGGTLILRNFGPMEHLDPQRNYVGATISFINRTMVQTLTTYPPKTGKASGHVVPDAATDTGTASDNNKTWKFTLRKGLKWQDGKPVTCKDYKYGASRTFAVDQITDGPQYQVLWLDIPKNSDGSSKYAGPYKGAGQKYYDKAVTCDGRTITYHLSSPHSDFNQAVTYPAFSAVRKDKDTGTKYDFTPFSDGPYKLQGKWDKDTGGMLVRNKQWSSKADGGLRKAYPDKIKVEIGDSLDTIAQAIISDSGDGKSTVSYSRIPPSKIAATQSNPRVKERTVTDVAPYTDYLWFNLRKKSMKNKLVREAIATAFNRKAYATALGGKFAMKPANGGIINPTLAKGFEKFDPFDAGATGNIPRAKKLLAKAGVKTPYPITYTYRGSPQQDKASASIQEQLGKAGFKVKLKKVPNSADYYTKISTDSFDSDVDFGWTSWGADWQSGSTVVPTLYTSGQLQGHQRAQNYSAFKDPAFDKKVQENYKTKDPEQAEKNWTKLDQEVIKKAVYYPIGYNTFTYTYGSNVKNFVFNRAMGACVDLAVVAVK